MPSMQPERSDDNPCPTAMDIVELAQEFEIDPNVLKTALGGAKGLLLSSRANLRPADKMAMRGVTKWLEQTVNRLSDEAVRERLAEANFQKPDDPDEDGLAYYTAWCTARDRVERAYEGTVDLLALVRVGEEFRIPPGRPGFDDWTVAIGSLLEFWADDLRREITISGHASDPRGVRPSRTLRFVHQCMRQIGEEISEQQCRTVLERLRVERASDRPV